MAACALAPVPMAAQAQSQLDVQAQLPEPPPPPGRRLPLWEAGLGLTALHFVDYRGSAESRNYLLPIPYFVYRGEWLQVDRLGVRGLLLRTPRFTLDVSVSGNPPVSSRDNRARAGMPDLRPLLEAGPLARLRLWGADADATRLDLRLPLRMAFAVSRDGLRDVGLVANPQLALDTELTVAGRRWNVGAIAGVVYGNRRYHDYFYGVAPDQATAARPAFQARGGYGGPQLLLSASRRFDGFWVGGFVRYDSVQGAAFQASPLVTARSSVSAGVAISWVLAASSRLVERPD